MSGFQNLSKQLSKCALLRKTFYFNSRYCSNKMTTSSSRECEEVQIKMPWGHISGKWWGRKDVRPILGLHGWQDNAGTFDTLAPHLPEHIGLLSVDLPGHGFSSRLPDGVFYNRIDTIYVIKLIMKEYNWDKVSILSHSLSSSVGFLFSALLPNEIDIMIGMDMFKPLVRPISEVIPHLSNEIGNFLIADERNRDNSEPPSYTFDECVERFYAGYNKSIDKDKCHYILNRNLRKSLKYPDKYYFSRDGRLKCLHFGTFFQELNLELAAKIQIPYLFLKFKGAPYFEDKKHFDDTLEIMQKNPQFEFGEIDGSHHVHLNEPEKVCGVINQFINKYKPA